MISLRDAGGSPFQTGSSRFDLDRSAREENLLSGREIFYDNRQSFFKDIQNSFGKIKHPDGKYRTGENKNYSLTKLLLIGLEDDGGRERLIRVVCTYTQDVRGEKERNRESKGGPLSIPGSIDSFVDWIGSLSKGA